MEKFRLHFFKENTREIDLKETISFFEAIDGFEIESDDKGLRFIYKDHVLKYEARFLILQKSQVRDIYRLNPKFLDINFQMEVNILTPNYFFEKMIDIVKKLTERFNYYVYHETFENVLNFRRELITKVFTLLKERYIQLNPKLLNEYHLVKTEKLNSIMRYMEDNLELHKFYEQSNTYVPMYHFLINKENELKLAFEWKHNTLTVLPPNLDYIFINRGSDMMMIKFDEFYDASYKFLEEVPGFIKNTYVVKPKSLKKINKILRRKKFSKVLDVFSNTSHTKLID